MSDTMHKSLDLCYVLVKEENSFENKIEKIVKDSIGYYIKIKMNPSELILIAVLIFMHNNELKVKYLGAEKYEGFKQYDIENNLKIPVIELKNLKKWLEKHRGELLLTKLNLI